MTVVRLDNVVLHLSNVSHAFGATEVLRSIELTVYRSEFVAIVGPSGCGKTTLLSLASGWIRPIRGIARRRGRVRTVFQHSGLFPWMTVDENVSIALTNACDAGDAQRRKDRLVSMAGLTSFENHYPHQLSGGMRQRAELVRALAADSELLLLDEPFSSLDYLTRLRMRQELAQLLAEHPRTVLLVTHDIEEAAQLADRVVVLSDRPATVLDSITLPSLRPRDVTDPSIGLAVHRIFGVLGHGREASTSLSLSREDRLARR